MLQDIAKNFYDLAFEIRYRSPLSYCLRWVRDVLRFAQIVIFMSDFCKVKEINTRTPTLLRILNNAGLLNFCFDFSVIPVFFNLLQLILLCSFFWFFYYNCLKVKNGKYVSKNILFIIVFGFEFLFPVFQIQFFFRFTQQFLLILQKNSILSIFSFLILVINIIICFCFDFISSVFFRPKVIVTTALIDNFTGVTEPLIFWCRFTVVTVQLLLSQYRVFIIELIMYSWYPIVVIIILEKRISTGVHVNIIGAMLNDSPLFAAPFVLLSNLHPHNYLLPGAILVTCILFYALIFVLYKIFMRKYASLIFSQKYDPPWWLQIKYSLVMRTAAENEADVEAFEDYIVLRMKQDPEEMIEVVRFLGIFRSQREKIMLMISKYKETSIYYDYQFYLFTRIFLSYENKPPAHYIQILDDLQRNFYICLSLFWQKRAEHNNIIAFIFGIKTALIHVELLNYIQYLCFIYQYDPYLHQAYAEIQLIAEGDARQSVLYRRYASMLKDNSKSVADPIFKSVASYYPISSERYVEENTNSNSATSSKSDLGSLYSYSHLRFHVDEKVIYRDEDSDNSLMAMFVRKCRDVKSYSVLISMILLILWTVVFIFLQTKGDIYLFEYVMNVKELVKETIDLSIRLTSGIILQPILLENNKTDAFSCQKMKENVYNYLQSYSFTLREDYYYVSKAISLTSSYIATIPDNNCQVLKNDTKIIMDSLEGIKVNYEYFHGNYTIYMANDDAIVIYWRFFVYLILAYLFGLTLTVYLMFLSVKLTLINLPQHAQEFLGSKERLSMLLLKKSLESWDLFKFLFPDPRKPTQTPVKPETPPVSTRRIKVTKYSSATNIQMTQSGNSSHHVNLKDAKVSISFIGADNILKPSMFGLMSPFVISSTTNSSEVSSENSESWDNSSSNRNEDAYVVPETVENYDIVSKMIDHNSKEFKSVILALLIIYTLPYLVMMFFNIYERVVLEFQRTNSRKYLNRMVENISTLHNLPQEIYIDNHTNLTLVVLERSTQLNQKLSIYSRGLGPFLEDSDKISYTSQTGLLAFSTCTFIFAILTWFVVYDIDRHVTVGFNSLFHFPSGYLEDINKPRDDDTDLKLPKESIICLIVTNDPSAVITNISQNCADLINVQPIDVIGRKYDEVFPMDSEKNRLYYISQKKVKKYVESRYSTGKIVRIALYDMQSDNSPRTVLSNRLTKCLPCQIAKFFCEKGAFHYKFKNSFIVVVTFDSTTFNPTIDHVFMDSSNILQSYNSIMLLRVNGSQIFYFCYSNDRNIPILFTKDLIYPPSSSNLKALATSNNQNQQQSPIRNVVITKSEFTADIMTDYTEPYISVNYQKKIDQMRAGFLLEEKSLLIMDDCIKIGKKELCQRKEIIRGIRGTVVKFADIPLLIQELR